MTFYLHSYPYRRTTRRWVENNQQTLGVNVPGLKSDDVNIQVLDDVVRIEGEYKQDETQYLVQELPNGSFTRTLRLPAAIDADSVEAKIADGVLTLRLPKVASAKPKQIRITSK